LQRIDKFLWFSRFYKSRTLASSAVSGGLVRINGNRCDKPSADVKAGDVLTFTAGTRVRIVRVVSGGTRRGPASEAQALYEDLTPPFVKPEPELQAPGQREKGAGRPTKKERRATSALKAQDE